jgi:phosphatidylglycerophosphate synthase
VVDRWAEALIFCGLAWYYRSSWVLALVLVAIISSFMVSYARARGESLGAEGADVGAMQRPERILYLGVGVAMSPMISALESPSDAHPLHVLAVIALSLVAATALGTALRRSWAIFRELERAAPAPPPVEPVAPPAPAAPRAPSPDESGELHADGGEVNPDLNVIV